MEYKSTKAKAPNSYFSKEFKIAVIEEYLRSGLPKSRILKKYSIKFQGALQSWMREYGYEDPYRRITYAEIKKESNLAHINQSAKSSNSKSDTQTLDKKIKELERLLQEERLKSEAYSRMIDLAEGEYKITIRKKSGTK